MPDLGIIKALARGAKRAKVARGAVDVQAADKILATRVAGEKKAAQDALEQQIAAERAKLPARPVEAPVAKVNEGELQAPEASGVLQKAEPIPKTVEAPEPKLLSDIERPLLQAGAKGVVPEAVRLSKIELGQYDLEEMHQLNFSTMTTTDDLNVILADAAQLNKGRIDEARRGVITNEQVRLLAADLNVEEDVLRPVLQRETGDIINAEHVLAARQLLAESANVIKTLGDLITTGKGTDLDKLMFRRQIMLHDDFQSAFMGARAEVGRALNAFNIPVGLELDPAKLQKMLAVANNLNGNDTVQLAQMMSSLESVGQVSKLAKQYTRSKILGVLQELFITSILSGPKTHIVNTIGNALFQIMQPLELGVAAMWGKILPGADHVQIGESLAMLFGQLSGWRDGMRYAWIAMKNGEALDAVTKFETRTKRAISSQNLLPDGAPASLAAALDWTGHIVRVFSERVMIPTDEFFKTIAVRSDLARQSYLEVQARFSAGETMSKDQIADFVQRFIETPTALEREVAEDYARYVTFQSDLGEVGQVIQKLAAKGPGFMVAPFVRTPVNIFKAGILERSPLAAFTRSFWSAMRKGGPERDLALARFSMGSLTAAGIASMAADGVVTGGGPQDPGQRAILEKTGWLPYSFRYRDPISGEIRYQSYARAEPLAFVIGATADMVEIGAYLSGPDDPLSSDAENLNRAAAAIVAGIANNTMSKTFFSGLTDAIQALDDPGRYMANWATRTSLAFLPFSAFRRQIGLLQDPVVREAWDYVDKLKATSGLAGYSKDMPPRRDIFGSAKRPAAGSLLGVMSAFPDTVEKKNDPILNEIIRVMKVTDTVPVTMPSKRILGMRLTTQEYDDLVVNARAMPDQNGNTFYDTLANLFESEVYQRSTDYMRASLISQRRTEADERGRQWLEDNNESFRLRIEEQRRIADELKYGAMQ